jgi:hypothetical protein
MDRGQQFGPTEHCRPGRFLQAKGQYQTCPGVGLVGVGGELLGVSSGGTTKVTRHQGQIGV